MADSSLPITFTMKNPTLQFFILVTLNILLPLLTLTSQSASDPTSSSHSISKWFSQLPSWKEKYTHLHFYFHDRATGPHPTVIEVARSNLTDTFTSQFGLVYIADDLLTDGLEEDSMEIGRAQGISGMADREEAAQVMGFNFVFTAGLYNGSSLAVFSRNPIWHTERELAVVGGTGDFRLARGVAALKTTSLNFTTMSVTVKYDVFVVHY